MENIFNSNVLDSLLLKKNNRFFQDGKNQLNKEKWFLLSGFPGQTWLVLRKSIFQNEPSRKIHLKNGLAAGDEANISKL